MVIMIKLLAMVPFKKKESTTVILQKPLLIPIVANGFYRITVIDAHISQQFLEENRC
jgi:hypothetical protein